MDVIEVMTPSGRPSIINKIVIGFIILYKRFGECSSKDPIMLSPIHIKQFSKSERLCVNRKTRLE